MNQREFAIALSTKAFPVQQAVISRLESGEQVPSVHLAFHLEDRLQTEFKAHLSARLWTFAPRKKTKNVEETG